MQPKTVMRIAAPLAALLIGGAAWADGTYVEVQCQQSNRDQDFTHCVDPAAAITLDAASLDAIYDLKFTAPPAHCSQVTYMVALSRDPGTIFASTTFLAANESQQINIGRGFGPGPVTLYVFASGRVGGCNEGVMHSWGAIVEVIPRGS